MLRGLLFFGMVSGWALAASCLYVVRTPTGWTILPKDSLTFVDTYADTRNWKADDLAEHKALVQRLISTDRADELSDVKGIGGEGDHLKKKLSEEIGKAATSDAGKTVLSRVFGATFGG